MFQSNKHNYVPPRMLGETRVLLERGLLIASDVQPKGEDIIYSGLLWLDRVKPLLSQSLLGAEPSL